MLDVEGYVTTWNAGARRMKGYNAEEILGHHFSSLFTAEDQKKKRRKELHTALTKGRYEEEGWRMRKDGSRF
jgi:hypothetical protein